MATLLQLGKMTLAHDENKLLTYLSHRSALVSYASRITGNDAAAEDVVQDAWLKLGQPDEDYIIERPLSFLYRLVRNLAIDGRRRMARDQKRAGADMDVATLIAPDEMPSAERAMMAEEELSAVRAVMAMLPKNQRIALEMYRFGDCKLRDIANRLEISVSYAHVLVSEAVATCDKVRARDKK